MVSLMLEMELVQTIIRATLATGLVIAGIMAIFAFAKQQDKISYLRLLSQIASVPIIFLALSGMIGLLGTNILGANTFPDGLSVPFYACFYPDGRTMTCAIWQIQSYIYPYWTSDVATGGIYILDGLTRLGLTMGLIVLMSVILGRFFCGWICPFGLYMDLLSKLRKTLRIGYWRLSKKLNDAVRQIRYPIIASLFIIPAITISEIFFRAGDIFNPGPGYFLSVPFCQVCAARPLFVLVEGVIGTMDLNFITSMTIGQFYHLGMYVTSVNIGVLVVFSAASFMIRRFWCRWCPLGGLIALFNRFIPFKWAAVVRLNKTEEKCTKCGICKRVCPPQVEEVYEEKGGDVTASGCILCMRCVELCPYDDCLEIDVAGKPIYKSKNWLKGGI